MILATVTHAVRSFTSDLAIDTLIDLKILTLSSFRRPIWRKLQAKCCPRLLPRPPVYTACQLCGNPYHFPRRYRTRVYNHTTTATHEIEVHPPSLPFGTRLYCAAKVRFFSILNLAWIIAHAPCFGRP